MRPIATQLGCLLVLLHLALCGSATAAVSKPNILIVLTDDQGVPEQYSAPYKGKGPAGFFGMIANLDENLGQLE